MSVPTNDGNEGFLRIHRSGKTYTLKLFKDRKYYELEKSTNKPFLEKLRLAIYDYYGPYATKEDINKEHIVGIANKLSFQIKSGVELETESVEKREKAKIKIVKERKSTPNCGDFIIIDLDVEEKVLGIFTTIPSDSGEDQDYVVLLETGEAIEYNGEKWIWKFAKVKIEAEKCL